MQLREILEMIELVCKNLENLDSINYFCIEVNQVVSKKNKKKKKNVNSNQPKCKNIRTFLLCKAK